jgi:hypothetical protein
MCRIKSSLQHRNLRLLFLPLGQTFPKRWWKGYSPKLGQYNPTAWLCPVSLGGLLNSVEEEKVSFRIWSPIKEECDSCKWLYLSKDLFLNYRSSMASGTDESFLFSVILTESFRHLLGTLELPLTCSSCLTCMCHCHWLSPLCSLTPRLAPNYRLWSLWVYRLPDISLFPSDACWTGSVYSPALHHRLSSKTHPRSLPSSVSRLPWHGS